jgi:hypothetical protein
MNGGVLRGHIAEARVLNNNNNNNNNAEGTSKLATNSFSRRIMLNGVSWFGGSAAI